VLLRALVIIVIVTGVIVSDDDAVCARERSRLIQ
jgi:hypothetical protein